MDPCSRKYDCPWGEQSWYSHTQTMLVMTICMLVSTTWSYSLVKDKSDTREAACFVLSAHCVWKSTWKDYSLLHFHLDQSFFSTGTHIYCFQQPGILYSVLCFMNLSVPRNLHSSLHLFSSLVQMDTYYGYYWKNLKCSSPSKQQKILTAKITSGIELLWI